MWLGQDDTVQGLGCPGGTCVGADGNLYEWVSGVDGLGNPVGFWKRIRRGVRRLAPIASRLAPLVPGGAAAAAALRFATPHLRRAVPSVARVVEQGGAAGWGSGALGEVAQGPDGNLYQWVQGVDGLGNPIGFWKKIRRGLKRVTRRLMPLAQRIAPFVPGGAAALTVATPFLKQAGLVGYDGLGALYQAPDGSLYQVQGVEGEGEGEGDGMGQDDELRGLSQEELQGLSDDEELRGLAQDDELSGLGQDDELQGFADDELQGFADEDVQGVEGYVRENGVRGFEAYVPDAPRETPWFKAPGQPPPLWSPLW